MENKQLVVIDEEEVELNEEEPMEIIINENYKKIFYRGKR